MKIKNALIHIVLKWLALPWYISDWIRKIYTFPIRRVYRPISRRSTYSGCSKRSCHYGWLQPYQANFDGWLPGSINFWGATELQIRISIYQQLQELHWEFKLSTQNDEQRGQIQSLGPNGSNLMLVFSLSLPYYPKYSHNRRQEQSHRLGWLDGYEAYRYCHESDNSSCSRIIGNFRTCKTPDLHWYLQYNN